VTAPFSEFFLAKLLPSSGHDAEKDERAWDKLTLYELSGTKFAILCLILSLISDEYFIMQLIVTIVSIKIY
jgi:hypothetical protein